MACGKGNLREEEKSRNEAATAASSSVVVSDSVLFATMCIIGMPVDVHVRDGSVYSGIFYTACVDRDYAVVLKNAKMIKKGDQEANVVSGSLIETLIIPSENFVQVVAKEVRLPANGVTGSGGGKGMEEAIVGYIEYPEREAKVIIANESGGDKKHKNRTRPVDGPQEIKRDSKNISKLQDERISHEPQVSSPSTTMTISEKTDIQESRKKISADYSTTHENQRNTGPTSDGAACSVGSSPKASATSTPSFDINTESRLRASSASYIPLMPSKGSNFQRTAKESTLNPGAKIFSPSILHHRSTTPPAMPNGAGVSYMPDVAAMAPMASAPQGVDISSFAHPSMPVKFVPYNNVAIGDGGHDVTYVQPVIGQMVSRTQPVRYAGQYHNFQTGPGYVQSNPQNVTLGRVGHLVCMHPISSDVVQNAAGFSQPNSRSLITPHLPKNQGNASAQALQLCVTPPIIANAPQQFAMPSSIPISQPLFPVLRPIAVPRSNGFFNSKFT
ncbi:uncharacterized protein [Primulina huaijiensis]|uniref:uncharacterized protein isoform X6 n=1 Tax=Primulina huaijiensis TaxID=1492673 RepID=UPI003CC75FF6